MSEEKRFPSDANKDPSGKKQSNKEPEKKQVEGKKEQLVMLHYKIDNHLQLKGVHALIKGLNHLPENVWDEHKNHPTILKLIKDGQLEEIKPKSKKDTKKEDEKSE